ncbi:MAG: Gfo/Idh/MocA family oxidoreductase [Planctomycetota bacterium]|nr:Gfo/Idh/MocA family oxidoreductase [Planctomycetota bacterium]
MSERSLRIGLVGCGQIADAHLQQIRRAVGADAVAVCDSEPLLARQAAERFDVPMQFSSLNAMLREARPDVVHVTTPVHTHAPLSIKLLNAGVHVYVEKPFTVDADEARQVIDVAEQNGRLVCIGHDQLLDPEWVRVCEIVASGMLGEIHHVDSVLGYPINGPFGRHVVASPNHWVRKLPGGLIQNTVSHPLYRITEFLDDAEPSIQARWFSRLPEVPFPTELRANLQGEKVSGSLLFTSTTKPYQRVTRLYGTEAGLEVDLNTQVIRFHQSGRYPGAFAKLEAPYRQLRESCGNLKRSVGRFVRGELHYFEGMKRLFESFYESVREASFREVSSVRPPVTHQEAVRVTSIMDRIFKQCRDESGDFAFGAGQKAAEEKFSPARSTGEDRSRETPAELVGQGHL